MEKNYIKIPTTGVIFFGLLLAAVTFYAGYAWTKIKGGSTSTTPTTTTDASNSVVFAASKTDKPELSFYVMSFCPYGNQMEDVLRPVYDLLKDKANLTPHYIFDKIDNLKTFCTQRSGDPTQCATYVQNKYFATEAECKTTIEQNLKSCLDEKAYLKTGNGAMFASLHGRQEANQDVREMCAWGQVGNDKAKWWDFVGNVNKNCTAENADTCWEQQAKQAGLDTSKITECFNKDAVNLIEKEIALTTQYKVQGSPTVMVNNVIFPPESAYTQDGKGTLKIGTKVASQDKFRTPNVVKEAICASFNKAPKECGTLLNELTGAAPGPGACN
jgi:hypothetical protein